MEKDIYAIANQLKEDLQNDIRVKKLQIIEQEMDNDKNVMSLAYAKDVAASEYSDILNHFNEESEMAKKYQRKLYETKKALDEHPLVQQYLKAYKEVRELYDEINHILFSDLSIDLCPRGK